MITEEYSDLERDVVDHLAGRVPTMPPGYQDTTVGIGLPQTWTVASPPHVGVAVDGSTETRGWAEPVLETATVRITAWADSPTRVKQLARLARTAALGFPARPGAGVLATVDPDNHAPVAYFTVVIRRKPNR